MISLLKDMAHLRVFKSSAIMHPAWPTSNDVHEFQTCITYTLRINGKVSFPATVEFCIISSWSSDGNM